MLSAYTPALLVLPFLRRRLGGLGPWERLEAARDALKAMLKAGGPPPEGRFADLKALEVVRDYPPRHASTMLAFEAVVEAAHRARTA